MHHVPATTHDLGERLPMRDAELAILMGVTFGAVAVAVRRTRFAAAAQRAGVIAIGVTVERGRARAQLACSDRREPLALGGARRRERRRSGSPQLQRPASRPPGRLAATSASRQRAGTTARYRAASGQGDSRAVTGGPQLSL